MNDLDEHERNLVYETMCSLLRHDVRNKVSSARMAAHWLHKKGLAAGLDSEKRFEQFHAVLNSELVAIDELLTARLPSATGRFSTVGNVSPQMLVDRAVSGWPWPGNVTFDNRSGDGDGALRFNAMIDDAACALRAVLRNAAEASPPGAAVQLHVIVDEKSISFEVHDRGDGLTEDQRLRASHGFSSTKPGHTGLGIAVATRIARAHGGDLVFAVEPPTRVTVRLSR